MATGPPSGSTGDDHEDPQTVREVVARAHERDVPALVAPERATDYSARKFATGVRKGANLLSHYGVGADRPVAVAVGAKDPPAAGEPGWLGTAADPLLAILGGMTLGVPVEPASDPTEPIDAPVLVLPTAWLDRFEASPGTSVVAYGGPPEDPAVSHFERDRWSENPVEPPEPLEPARTALRIDGSAYSQRDLVTLASEAVQAYDLGDAVRVRVAAPVDSVGGFVAGVLAPLVAGTPIRPVPEAESRGVERGVFAVAGDERRRLTVEDVA